MKKIICVLALLDIFYGCSTPYNSVKFQEELDVNLVDPSANKETVILFYNLKDLAKEKIIFGHHHSTAYGIGWMGEEDRSDVKDVTGSHAGVLGWDFADIFRGEELIGKFRDLVIDGYEKGAVNVFAWHYDNPITHNSFYDTTIAVKHIIPGGALHEDYKKDLDKIASFIYSLRNKDGELIPIIFRPFHEFDGSWFWWGANFTTREEFKKLWRFTVDYLLYEKHLDNILYAFSPDRLFYSGGDFLYKYPGDEYVDVIGMDDYGDFTPEGDGLEWVTKKLKIISVIAEKQNKIAALTETGLERIPDSTWWTQKLFKALDNDSIKIAYVMVWRNAHKDHFYAPYKGQISAQDFIKFKEKPEILFMDELPPLYKLSDGEAYR